MIEAKSLQERVRSVRLFGEQREIVTKEMPSWDRLGWCAHCEGNQEHLDLAFEEPDPEGPYLTVCLSCFLVTFPNISVKGRVRQIRAWHKWAQETGHTVPVWLFLLPGEPGPEQPACDDGLCLLKSCPCCGPDMIADGQVRERKGILWRKN